MCIGKTLFDSNSKAIRHFVTATKKHLPPLEKKVMRAEDILNSMLPPREWVEQGKHYIQQVSHEVATRIDVARLREMLDQKLQERQARETGLCPVREELFN